MKLFNDFINDYFKLAPLNATYVGINDYNDKLKNYYAEKDLGIYFQFLKKYLKLVNIELKKVNLSNKNNRYLKVLKYRIEMDIENYKFNFHYLPINSYHNPILSWVKLCSGDGFINLKTVKEFNDFIKRTDIFCNNIDSMIDRMDDGIKNDMVQPKKVMLKIVKDLENVIKNENYILNKKDIPKTVYKEYQTVIIYKFTKQIKKLIKYIKTVYIKKCHNGFGLKYIKNGPKMYEYLVRYHTTLKNPNIKEIHKLGLLEIERIQNDMDELYQKYSNIYKDLVHYDKLKNDKTQIFKSEQEIISSYKKLRIKLNNTVLKEYFDENEKVNINYDIKKIPEYLQENSTGAYYQRSNIDHSRKGAFYINTNLKDKHYKYNSYSLSAHEGNPGHHYQISYSNDMKNPLFISFYEDETAYIEGWGLYAEFLGREYLLKKKILLKDEIYDLFGSYNMEMLRAVRLVIDTGIHYYGWDYKKCHNFMKKYVDLGEKDLENEIYRYSLYPGQALAYKIGELKFKELKEKNKKDIKKFHHNILKFGSCPLFLL